MEISILSGNDFTKPFVEDFKVGSGKNGRLEESAQWFLENVKSGHKLEEHPQLKKKLVM